MDLKSLPLSQRLAAGCGCVVVLVTIVGAVLYGAFEMRANARIRQDIASAPPGWAGDLRALSRRPDLSGLTLERTDSGDAAAEALDSARAWRRAGVETAYRNLMGVPATASSLDSTIWRMVAGDSGLDRYVALARRREWRALDRMTAAAGAGAARNVFALATPLYGDLRNAGRGLVLRAMMRLDHGDRAGARTDLGAAVALGEQVFAREPTMVGTLIGRAMMSSGAAGWLRLAGATGDAALASRAQAVRAWASAPPGPVAELLLASPDTALALARDTSLALGMRAEALSDIVLGYLVRPSGSLLGVPRRYRRAMADLADDPDRDFARFAAMTSATAGRVHFFGVNELIRETQPREGR